MATINYAAREISVKIVYYGPGLSGKTTNLQIIHRKTPKDTRSDMVSLATETDRTLFFDFLPIDLGKIRGFTTKFQLYTVPGQIYYNATRKLVLRGVDGIVFVADSDRAKMAENIESYQNMEENLAEYGYNREIIPTIIQYNKRDLPNIFSIEELEVQLNKHKLPSSEAIAFKGDGVFESLKMIGKLVIDQLNKKYASPSRRRSSTSSSAAAQQQVAPAPVAPTPPPVQQMQQQAPTQSPTQQVPIQPMQQPPQFSAPQQQTPQQVDPFSAPQQQPFQQAPQQQAPQQVNPFGASQQQPFQQASQQPVQPQQQQQPMQMEDPFMSPAPQAQQPQQQMTPPPPPQQQQPLQMDDPFSVPQPQQQQQNIQPQAPQQPAMQQPFQAEDPFAAPLQQEPIQQQMPQQQPPAQQQQPLQMENPFGGASLQQQNNAPIEQTPSTQQQPLQFDDSINMGESNAPQGNAPVQFEDNMGQNFQQSDVPTQSIPVQPSSGPANYGTIDLDPLSGNPQDAQTANDEFDLESQMPSNQEMDMGTPPPPPQGFAQPQGQGPQGVEPLYFTSVDPNKQKKNIKKPVNPKFKPKTGIFNKFFNKEE